MKTNHRSLEVAGTNENAAMPESQLDGSSFSPGASKAPISFSRQGRGLKPGAITRLMAVALNSPDLLSLAAGFTDNATLPVEIVRETVDRMLSRAGGEAFLQYGTNEGRPRLRERIARRMAVQDGLAPEAYPPDAVMVANGAQQILALATQVLCDPGDIVLVEQPTYFVYLDVLRGLGVEALSLPVDGSARLDSKGTARMLDKMGREGSLGRIKAVYLVGYYANPSSRTLSESEKIDLAGILTNKGLRLPVIEDAAYRELGFDGWPSERSVLALDAWSGFPRLHAGTLTKPFATGFKVGFGYSTHGDWLDRMLCLKGQHDFGTANFPQAILEEVLAGEEYDRHLVRIRRHYRDKMAVLDRVLREEGLPAAGWKWRRPAGGLYLWLEGPPAFDTGLDSPFFQTCLEHKVFYVPGVLCFPCASRRNFVRLSYGVLPPPELEEAGRRFAAAVKDHNRRTPGK